MGGPKKKKHKIFELQKERTGERKKKKTLIEGEASIERELPTAIKG